MAEFTLNVVVCYLSVHHSFLKCKLLIFLPGEFKTLLVHGVQLITRNLIHKNSLWYSLNGTFFKLMSMRSVLLWEIYSAIHKVDGLTVPGRSMTSTGTIPVEQKSVHWLSMGATSRNGLWGCSSQCFFWKRLVTKEPAALSSCRHGIQNVHCSRVLVVTALVLSWIQCTLYELVIEYKTL